MQNPECKPPKSTRWPFSEFTCAPDRGRWVPRGSSRGETDLPPDINRRICDVTHISFILPKMKNIFAIQKGPLPHRKTERHQGRLWKPEQREIPNNILTWGAKKRDGRALRRNLLLQRSGNFWPRFWIAVNYRDYARRRMTD